MTDQVLVANKTISSADSIEILFASPVSGLGTTIKAMTVTNNSAASASYKAYIYNQDGVAVGAIVPQTIIVKDRFDSARGVVNQIVPTGGTLRAENSTGGAFNFYITGAPL